MKPTPKQIRDALLHGHMGIEDLCIGKEFAQDPFNFEEPRYEPCRVCNGYDKRCQYYVPVREVSQKNEDLKDG